MKRRTLTRVYSGKRERSVRRRENDNASTPPAATAHTHRVDHNTHLGAKVLSVAGLAVYFSFIVSDSRGVHTLLAGGAAETVSMPGFSCTENLLSLVYTVVGMMQAQRQHGVTVGALA